MTIRTWSAVVLAVCAISAPLLAKGPTTRIVISGPGLSAPVEITDSTLLRQFVVWAGAGVTVNGQEQERGFIVDWPKGAVVKRPGELPRYQVSFYVKYANRPLESQEERLAYVVMYEPDEAASAGYVYLPGKGEEHFQLNVATMRRGREGQWFHASDAWNRAARHVLGPRLRHV